MNLQKIRLLLDKYELGETSISEEQELKRYFENEEIPIHLAVYKDLFVFYNQAGKEEIEDPHFDEKILKAIYQKETTESNRFVRTRKLYTVVGIAASIIIMVGFYFLFQAQTQTRDTFDDPQVAYLETKKILLKVSGNLNSGVGELANMKEINNGLNELNNIKTFDEGMRNMRKISVLDKSRDIITQKTNKQ